MSPDSIPLLNELLPLLSRSLPQYLQWSRPHVAPGREEALAAVLDVARDQEALAARVGRLIEDAGGRAFTGEFPMEFTDLHDLDLDFLLPLAVRRQQRDLAALGDLAQQASPAPAAKALIEEAVGLAKGHLETLRELGVSPAPA